MLHTKKLRTGGTVSSVIVGKGTTKNGTLLLKDMFGSTVFYYAKPVELISYILSKQTCQEFIVLDFFSGSGTTAHSVFLSNIEENKNIKFILVQLPEVINPEKATTPSAKKTATAAIAYLDKIRKPHLLTELAKERIKLSAIRVRNEYNKSIDYGFRVFKCDSSNMKDVYFSPSEYTQDLIAQMEDSIKEDRTDLDLLFDCMLRWGVELSLPLSQQKVGDCTIHNVNDGDLVACFDGKITEPVIDAIAALSPLRVVFRDSSFSEASEKMNLFELFKQKCSWSEQEVRNNVRVI